MRRTYRLLRTENEKDTDPSRNPELHILNNIKIHGLKFNHIVVIETALYLYRKRSAGRPGGIRRLDEQGPVRMFDSCQFLAC